MFGLVTPGNHVGIGPFIKIPAHVAGKAHGKGFNSAIRMPAHQSHNGTGIDTAAEKGAQGHIADQSEFYRFIQ